MSINAATASTYMPAFSPESGISLPVLYHDLGGKVIYATPEHKLGRLKTLLGKFVVEFQRNPVLKPLFWRPFFFEY